MQNFFMELKKGDSEDQYVAWRSQHADQHSAILMFNLFLGLDLDVYMCKGKTRFGADHVWVMTREEDGTVVFWETTNGKTYRVRVGWPALY